VTSTARSQPLVYVAFLFPAFAGFLFGYDIGATSGAVSNLGSMLHGAAGFDAGQQSLLTSSSLIGAFAGTFIVFFAGEPLGRRRELMVGATLYMLGTVLTASAPDSGAVVPCVVAGRLLYGLGIAFSMHAAPTYISETAPAHRRGLLVSLKEGFICLGILGGFGASAIFTLGSLGLGDGAWRFIWAVPAPVGLCILVGIYCMPASPRWLVLRAAKAAPPSQPLDTSAAEAALRRLRVPKLACCGGGAAAAEAEATAADPGAEVDLGLDAEIAAELGQIVDTLAAESGGSCAEVNMPRACSRPSPRVCNRPSPRRPLGDATNPSSHGARHLTVVVVSPPSTPLLPHPPPTLYPPLPSQVLRNRRALLAGLGLVLLQQVTGQPSVLYYQTAIFEHASHSGVPPPLAGDGAAVGALLPDGHLRGRRLRRPRLVGVGHRRDRQAARDARHRLAGEHAPSHLPLLTCVVRPPPLPLPPSLPPPDSVAWLLATHPTVTVAASQVDRFGRRPVLFVGISMMLGAASMVKVAVLARP